MSGWNMTCIWTQLLTHWCPEQLEEKPVVCASGRISKLNVFNWKAQTGWGAPVYLARMGVSSGSRRTRVLPPCFYLLSIPLALIPGYCSLASRADLQHHQVLSCWALSGREDAWLKDESAAITQALVACSHPMLEHRWPAAYDHGERPAAYDHGEIVRWDRECQLKHRVSGELDGELCREESPISGELGWRLGWRGTW